MSRRFLPLGSSGLPEFDGTFYGCLDNLGLTGGLLFCLDAGDALSYTSGDRWTDRSASSFDFDRGASTATGGDEPTFNGIAGGESNAEYWTFDGSNDMFEYESTNPASFVDWHEDNALFSFLCIWYKTSGSNASRAVVATCGLAGTRGMMWVLSGTGGGRLHVRGAGADVINVNPSVVPNSDAWNCDGISVDEAGGASASFFYTNGVKTTFNAAYSSPAAGVADHDARFGSGAGSEVFRVNDRLACMAGWSIARTHVDFDNIKEMMGTSRGYGF